LHGNAFEGASSEHEFTAYFPLPIDYAAKSGLVKFRYKTSSLAGTVSNLRIELNGRTVYSFPLATDPTISGMDIPLDADDLKAGQIKFTVRASIMPTDVRCFDERNFVLHYIQVLPETRLELTGLTSVISSLRGVWGMLPKHVTISVPKVITPAVMKVILQTVSHLRAASKTAQFVNFPEIGDVVIGAKAELTPLLAGMTSVSGGVGSDANISVMHRGAGQHDVIVLTDAAADRDLQLLSRDWRKVTLAGEYIDQTRAGGAGRSDNTFTLAEMGMSDEPHTINRTTEWKFFAGLPQVPGDMRIKSLNINVIAPPSKDRMSERLLLFVYVNNILQEVQPVENTGKTQSFKFNVANYSQWVGRNYVKIMAQRFSPRDCQNSLEAYKMQITPDSTIEFEKHEVKPKIFNDFHPYFARGFDLYISPEGFSSDKLVLLSTVLSDQKFDLADVTIKLFDEKANFTPTGPFMIYGRPKFALDDMTVHFERGPIEVVQDDKRVLLAVKNLAGISIAQVVKHNGFSGLVLTPAEDNVSSTIPEYFLEQGDTSFADPNGEVMNMRARKMNRAKVEYPEYLDFMERLGRYRFWLVALGWMSLALVLVMIYRRILQHQKTEK
jgi:hypothetical protein